MTDNGQDGTQWSASTPTGTEKHGVMEKTGHQDNEIEQTIIS